MGGCAARVLLEAVLHQGGDGGAGARQESAAPAIVGGNSRSYPAQGAQGAQGQEGACGMSFYFILPRRHFWRSWLFKRSAADWHGSMLRVCGLTFWWRRIR